MSYLRLRMKSIGRCVFVSRRRRPRGLIQIASLVNSYIRVTGFVLFETFILHYIQASSTFQFSVRYCRRSPINGRVDWDLGQCFVMSKVILIRLSILKGLSTWPKARQSSWAVVRLSHKTLSLFCVGLEILVNVFVVDVDAHSRCRVVAMFLS